MILGKDKCAVKIIDSRVHISCYTIHWVALGSSIPQEAPGFPIAKGGLMCGLTMVSVFYTLAATAIASFVPVVAVILEPERFPNLPREELIRRAANSISKFQ